MRPSTLFVFACAFAGCGGGQSILESRLLPDASTSTDSDTSDAATDSVSDVPVMLPMCCTGTDDAGTAWTSSCDGTCALGASCTVTAFLSGPSAEGATDNTFSLPGIAKTCPVCMGAQGSAANPHFCAPSNAASNGGPATAIVDSTSIPQGLGFPYEPACWCAGHDSCVPITPEGGIATGPTGIVACCTPRNATPGNPWLFACP